METVFAWRTIAENSFKKEVYFSYGDSLNTDTLSSWDSIYEDLEITVKIIPASDLADITSYVTNNERLGILITWKGDNKFSGCGIPVAFNLEKPLVLNCKINKGTCSSSIVVSCDLIVTEPEILQSGEWLRPPGSIISSLPIIEKISINKGNWFPIMEYEGDGQTFINWKFANIEDLDLSLSSGLLIMIDNKHPLCATLAETKDGQSLIMLLILQGLARKSFSKNIYDQLTTKIMSDEEWNPGTVGSSFHFIVMRLYSYLNVTSMEALKEIYFDQPEKIDESIDSIFFKSLMLKTIYDSSSI